MLRSTTLSLMLLITGVAAARADCAADFAAVMSASKAAGAYHNETQMTLGDETRTLISEFAPPDRVHIIKDATGHENVVLAEGAWTKVDGQWQTMPDKQRDQVLASKDYSLAGGFKAAKNVQCLGPQTIEGKSLTAFAFEMVNTAQNNTQLKDVLYADDKGFPEIVIADFEFSGKKFHTVSHVKYDPAISVEAPMAGAPPAAATAADPKCIAEVKAMASAVTKAGPQRYELADQSSASPMKITLEIVPATAMHMAWDGGEQIVTRSGGWMKEGGQWKPMPAGQAAEGLLELREPWWDRPETLANLKCEGPQPFEGQQVTAYSFDLDRFLGAATVQHVRLFKGAGELPVAMMVLKSGMSAANALSAHVAFDPSIKIEPPK